MKSRKIFVVLMLSVFMPVLYAASPAGNWTTVDDKSGKKRAIINIVENGDTLTATLNTVYPEPGDSPICEKCPGVLKNKPIKGLQFIWGLKDKGNGVWDGGKILDPQTGKVYSGKMTLEGNKLYVRGYIGFSAIGRSQVWYR